MPLIEETRPVRLELATAEDACYLTILQARAFLTEEDFVPPDKLKQLRRLDDPLIGPPGMVDPKWTKRVIESKESVYYRILLGDRIVGGLIVAADAEKHADENFWRIFVEPTYQDRGIGQEAMRQLYRLHANVRRWRLGTPEFHTKNRHFYERMGFTLLGIVDPPHVWFRSAEYENALPQEERLKL
jgi:GNAT superfamily N-acetyltransferase